MGGSDANDGSAEDKAFKTLAKAMEGVAYGDTVVALPGTYAEGTMLQSPEEAVGRGASMDSSESTLPSRVVVKAGVRLVSRDGAAATVIEGGTNTRCVFLCKGATLKGFTVQHGDLPEQSKQGMAQAPDTSGAGVLCFAGRCNTEEEFLGLVENCIIRDNKARLGAGGTYGTYRNCRFIGNDLKIHKPGVAARYCSLEGCFFEKNGPGNHCTIYGCQTLNCTVLAGQANSSGVIRMEGGYDRATDNTLILDTSIALYRYRNCVFGGAKISNLYEGKEKEIANSVTGAVELAENGAPLRGSPAIDAGDNAYVSEGLLAAGDPAGVQRIMNGSVDAGAYEYDWRGDYGKALGGRRLTVTDVPGEATLVGKNLVWADGQVDFDWATGVPGTTCSFTVTVAEGASLTVTLNGAVLGVYGPGTRTISFDSAAQPDRLTLAATGSVEASAFSRLTGTLLLVH